ncbi:hypothetical protein CDAR_296371 [Caerostris darwini]|uniref:Uncharacterized protein n=1 Tax=Caerostris darwini TaxID=1538125 RepID=A0AAV4PQI8_9ARAC|nr:hypothetical protein CDAR_296371 [Caerostris darwini]
MELRSVQSNISRETIFLQSKHISTNLANWNPLICTIPHVFPRRDSQQNASGCSRFIEVAAPTSGEKALSFLEEEEDMDDRVGR